MKALNSWVAAVVTCSAIVSQANADVLMLGSQDGARDVSAASHQNSFDVVVNTADENQRNSNRVRPVFVSGSLINKTSTGAWLMAQSIRRDGTPRKPKVDLNLLAGRGHGITPIPPAGSEMRPISTFAQFAQLFKPAAGSQYNTGEVQVMLGDDGEIVPKTSNMTLIGLFTFSLAGITAVISASRRGFFGRTPRQRRARMF